MQPEMTDGGRDAEGVQIDRERKEVEKETVSRTTASTPSYRPNRATQHDIHFANYLRIVPKLLRLILIYSVSTNGE